jgi:hypothetical protein
VNRRLDLPNGDWVDMTPRLNYAQRRRIMAAETTIAQAEEGVCAMVAGWALRDVDDQAIPFPERAVDGIAVEALATIPGDTFDLMAGFAADLIMEGYPDPKGSAGRSTGSQPASPPTSNRSSRTLTSSRSILDGAGTISNPPQPS